MLKLLTPTPYTLKPETLDPKTLNRGHFLQKACMIQELFMGSLRLLIGTTGVAGPKSSRR